MPPLKLNPNLPPELEGIIGRAMEKNRGNRYPDALAMKADLAVAEAGNRPELDQERQASIAVSLSHRTSTFQSHQPDPNLSAAGGQRRAGHGAGPGGLWWFKHRPAAAPGRKTLLPYCHFKI